MENFKLRSFLNLSNKDRCLKNALSKVRKNLDNIDYLRSIVMREIIPIAHKKGFNFTEDEFINYFKSNIIKLKKIDLKEVSGGVSAGKLTFGIANGIIGLTSVINSGIIGNSSIKAINNNKEKIISNLEKHKEEGKNYRTVSNLNNLLNEENKDLATNVNEENLSNKTISDNGTKVETNKENLDEIDIMGNSTYKIANLENLKGEKAVNITNLINNGKMSRIPDKPPTVSDKLIKSGTDKYKGTIFIIPKNINCSFDSNLWDQINTKDGGAILVHKYSKAYDYRDKLENLGIRI